MSDRRDQQLHFRVSKAELDRIHVKMAELGIVSIGAYLRKMALDGYCIRLDLQELSRMAYLLQMCSNNLELLTNSGIVQTNLFQICCLLKNGKKKDAWRRHPIYFIIRFKLIAVAERRQ